jgi:hypothetical protein
MLKLCQFSVQIQIPDEKFRSGIWNKQPGTATLVAAFSFSLIIDDAFEVPIVQRPREEEIQAITLLEVRDSSTQDFLFAINVLVPVLLRGT